MNSKFVDTSMNPNVELLPSQGESLSYLEKYKRLVEKLNYLTVTRPDISYAVSTVRQFLNSPRVLIIGMQVIHILKYIKASLGKSLLYGHNNHTKAVCYSNANWAGSPSDRRSAFGYCASIGDNLISCNSKKQNVVARSSAEIEYKVMALATSELIWLNNYLKNCNLERSLK